MSEVKIVQFSQIRSCPKMSLLPAHYRSDGTCRCDEREAAEREVLEAQQASHEAMTRLRQARERLAAT